MPPTLPNPTTPCPSGEHPTIQQELDHFEGAPDRRRVSCTAEGADRRRAPRLAAGA